MPPITMVLKATLLAALLAPLAIAPAQAETLSGMARIINGYTLEIDSKQVVLWGVNGPNEEESCISSKGKPFTCGLAAKRTLGVLIQGRPITCETKGMASNGLPTAICKLDGFDLAEQMAVNGWVTAMPSETKRYLYSQKTAIITRNGMWKSKKFKAEDIQGRR